MGMRTSVERLATLLLRCGRCGVDAAHHVTRSRRRFTLFFVPLFTVRTAYQTTCTYCGVAVTIDEQEADRLAAMASASPRPPTPGHVPPSPVDCPTCGAAVAEADVRCPRCDADLA